MASAAELAILLKVNDQGSKQLDQVADKAKGAGGALASMAKIAGGFALAQGLLQAPAVLGGLTSTARDLELQIKKANVVFGDQIGVVKEWADANATAMGLTSNQAVNLAAGLQDLLVPMGMTREKAMALSTKTVGLAGALAEWTGGQKSASEVADVLTKAYLGETDGLKALGIAISAEEVEARLAEKGMKDLTGQALQQAKAMAIQEMIFEKSTDAQKAFADGAGSAARKQAEMTAKLQEGKEKLAATFGPIIAQVTTLLANFVSQGLARITPLLEKLGPLLTTVSSAVKSFVTAIYEGVTGVDNWAVVTETLPGPLAKAAEFIGNIVTAMMNFGRYIRAVIEDGDVLNDWLSNLPGPLAQIAEGIGNLIVRAIALWPVIQQIGQNIWETVQSIVSWIKESGILETALAGVMTIGKLLWAAIEASLTFLAEHKVALMAIIAALGVLLVVLNPIPAAIGAIILAVGYLSQHWDAIQAKTVAIWQSIVAHIQGAIDSISQKAIAFGSWFVDHWQGIVTGVLAVVFPPGAGLFYLITHFEEVKEKVLGIATGIKDGIIGAFRDAVESVKGFLNIIIQWWNDLRIPSFDIKIKYLPDFHFGGMDLPDLPTLAQGGIVTRPTLAMIGERGPEAVVPLSGRGMGGGAINVTVNVQGSVIAERDLAANIRRELLKLGTRNVSVGLA